MYNESTLGDFSNSGLTPTVVTVGLGSNQIFGTTGNVAATDRDYFTITVPNGLVLQALTVLPGTTSGNISFIGLEAGNQVTLSTAPANASGLLGWRHYSPADINMDILPAMSVPANSSSGFNIPLPSGSYAFWVQDSSPGTFSYGLDVSLVAPEPAAYTMVIPALGALLIGLARSRRR